MSDTNQRIASIVNDNDVVLFMKGTPLFPQCGFSSRAIAILEHCGVAYESVDVLQDMEVRQGIKEFSDWPTIPQLYVKGEFLGGSDIMMEMYEAGELQQLLAEKQVARAEYTPRGQAEEKGPLPSGNGPFLFQGAAPGDQWCGAPFTKTIRGTGNTAWPVPVSAKAAFVRVSMVNPSSLVWPGVNQPDTRHLLSLSGGAPPATFAR